MVLTERGQQLTRQGFAVARDNDDEIAVLLGTQTLRQLLKLLVKLYRGLQLPVPGVIPEPMVRQLVSSALLPRISQYTMQRLMQLTIARGHPGLKMSHGQVLTLIGLDGGRIQQIARTQEVSKQAISAIAADLEALGYIERQPLPGDARQVRLLLSDGGMQLLADSCLLYTSPSPRDQRGSRMPSSA